MILYCLAQTHDDHMLYTNFRYAHFSNFLFYDDENYSYVDDSGCALIISIGCDSYHQLEWDETIWKYI